MECITERHPVSGPVVYGYLRLPPSQIRRRRALSQTLEVYCQQHELLLGGVFTDHTSTTLFSAAFAGLLGVLVMDGSYGVLLPTRSHLGGRTLAAERAALIDQLGRRLMVVRDHAPKAALR